MVAPLTTCTVHYLAGVEPARKLLSPPSAARVARELARENPHAAVFVHFVVRDRHYEVAYYGPSNAWMHDVVVQGPRVLSAQESAEWSAMDERLAAAEEVANAAARAARDARMAEARARLAARQAARDPNAPRPAWLSMCPKGGA